MRDLIRAVDDLQRYPAGARIAVAATRGQAELLADDACLVADDASWGYEGGQHLDDETVCCALWSICDDLETAQKAIEALARSGVVHCMFRDIRASAITAKEAREGMAAANAMGAHSTEAQTADYVRREGARKTGAAA